MYVIHKLKPDRNFYFLLLPVGSFLAASFFGWTCPAASTSETSTAKQARCLELPSGGAVAAASGLPNESDSLI